MATTRVYELAKDLGVESKDLLSRAQELDIEVKTASSGLNDDAVALLRMSYEEVVAVPAAAEPEPAAVAEPDEEPPAAVEDAAPVTSEPVAETPAGGRYGAGDAYEDRYSDGPPGSSRRPAPGATIELPNHVTVTELADAIGRGSGTVVKILMEMGEMASAHATVSPDAIDLLGEAFGYQFVVSQEVVKAAVVAGPVRPVFEDAEADLMPRPPIVTVMGHVDHGKTQLLDTIRRTNVVAGEAGGITQHIGAYQVKSKSRNITFIDTPGHEAFTALRARGANLTDIVILVVAANDGVMPQTVEAVSHAKAAGVPVIVALNKSDLPTADPVRVRAQLTEHGLLVEALGGEVLDAEVSALTGDGVDRLLDLIDLVAELEDFKANPDAPASGIVIESQLDKGRGPVGTVIVQRGTLEVGDALVAGAVAGRVRAMFDENGDQVKKAPPSTPVLVMGWGDVPVAGDFFQAVEDDKVARSLADEREIEMRADRLVVPTAQERLAQLLDQLRSADKTELRVIIKADAHGSLEAIKDSVQKIDDMRPDTEISVIHAAVGGINENDVVLAEASEAVVFGFNVRPDNASRKAAEQKGVEVRTYRIIYELLEEVEALLVGKLAPDEREVLLGSAEVRATFRAPRYGTVAGSYVTEGEMVRNARVRLVRQGVVVYDGNIASLRRFKEDVPSVATGFECGIGLQNFRDIKEGDVLESYQIQEVART